MVKVQISTGFSAFRLGNLPNGSVLNEPGRNPAGTLILIEKFNRSKKAKYKQIQSVSLNCVDLNAYECFPESANTFNFNIANFQSLLCIFECL